MPKQVEKGESRFEIQRQVVQRLYSHGTTDIPTLARQAGISYRRARDYVQRLRASGSLSRKPAPGRPRKDTPQLRGLMLRVMSERPRMNAKAMQQCLLLDYGLSLSVATVRSSMNNIQAKQYKVEFPAPANTVNSLSSDSEQPSLSFPKIDLKFAPSEEELVDDPDSCNTSSINHTHDEEIAASTSSSSINEDPMEIDSTSLNKLRVKERSIPDAATGDSISSESEIRRLMSKILLESDRVPSSEQTTIKGNLDQMLQVVKCEINLMNMNRLRTRKRSYEKDVSSSLQEEYSQSSSSHGYNTRSTRSQIPLESPSKFAVPDSIPVSDKFITWDEFMRRKEERKPTILRKSRDSSTSSMDDNVFTAIILEQYEDSEDSSNEEISID